MREYRMGAGEGGILFIHGWMHSSEIYRPLAEQLSQSWPVSLLDLPGFGGTPPENWGEKDPLEGMSRSLGRYLEGRFFDLIFAHSMGAALLLRVLDRRGELPCHGAVFCDPAYGGIPPLRRLSRSVRLNRALLQLHTVSPLSLDRPFAKLAALPTINRYNRINEAIVTSSRQSDPQVASVLFACLCDDSWRLEGVRESWGLHILAGAGDRIISRENLLQLEEDLCCPLTLVPGIGHTPVVEAPDYLAGFLGRLMESESGRARIRR